MATLYSRQKALKLKLSGKQQLKLGNNIMLAYQGDTGLRPPKIQVFLKAKKTGKQFYWWISDYPESFVPEMDKILIAAAASLKAQAKRKKVVSKKVNFKK
jgi:hypothetical protein